MAAAGIHLQKSPFVIGYSVFPFASHGVLRLFCKHYFGEWDQHFLRFGCEPRCGASLETFDKFSCSWSSASSIQSFSYRLFLREEKQLTDCLAAFHIGQGLGCFCERILSADSNFELSRLDPIEQLRGGLAK